MKKTLFLAITLFFCYPLLGQIKQTDSENPFDYEVNGYIKFFLFDVSTGVVQVNFMQAEIGSRFALAGIHAHSSLNGYLVKFLTFEKDPPTILGIVAAQRTPSQQRIVGVSQNADVFWISKDSFDELLEKKFILKRYYHKPSFAYGTSVSIPFKLRPEMGTHPMRITPEITLGGFIGGRIRLSRYKPIFATIPFTLGITAIGLNEGNVINVSASTTDVKDGLVLGRTWTTGVIFEYNDFQFGFIGGQDKASGEIGKNWIYNDKWWFSFSIGYSFFNRTTGREED